MNKKNRYLALIITLLMIFSLALFPSTYAVDFPDIDETLIGAYNDGVVYGDLNLPDEDINGNPILWEAETSDIVDITTGKILKRRLDGNISTYVTATIDGETETVPFQIGYLYKKNNSDAVFYEYFDDEEINGELGEDYPIQPSEEDEKNDHSLKIEEGELHLSRGSYMKGVNTQLQYNMGDISYTNGKSKVLISFDLKMSGDSNQILNYYFRTNNKVSSYQSFFQTTIDEIKVNRYNSETSKNQLAASEEIDFTQKRKIEILLDYDKDTYSMWVDSKLIAKECEARGTDNYTANLYITDNAGNEFDLYIDNFEIFDVAPTPLVDITMGLINGRDSNEIKENLYLPSQTNNGEVINWISKNGNIVISGEEGIVEFGDEDKNDVIIATTQIDDVIYEKSFEFIIPKYKPTFSSAPSPIVNKKGKEIIAYEENFEDTTEFKLRTSGYLYLEEVESGVMKVEDGKLVITNDTAGEKHCHYNLSTMLSNINDRLVIEFDVIRENTKGFYIWIQPDSNMASNAQVLLRVNDSIWVNNSEAGYVDTGYTYTKIKRTSKIVVMVCKDSTFSMWIDGERVIDRANTKTTVSSMSVITRLNLRSMANMGNIFVDNLRIYEASLSQIEIVEEVLAGLKQPEEIIKRDENGDVCAFEYTGKNENGCVFTYSSEKNLVNEDGSINYPLKETIDNVTVTVTSPMGYSEEKTFENILIPANYVFGEVIHDVDSLGLMSGENEFIIPAKSRGDDPDGGVSVITEVFDARGNSIVKEILDGQTLKDGADCFIGAVNLDESMLPEISKIKIGLYGSEAQELLTEEFEIIGG